MFGIFCFKINILFVKQFFKLYYFQYLTFYIIYKFDNIIWNYKIWYIDTIRNKNIYYFLKLYSNNKRIFFK